MFPLADLFGALDPRHGHGRRRDQRPGVGPRLRRAGRVPVPREPAAAPDRRAERDPRPDPDRHRRLAQDPRRPRHADRRGRARATASTLPAGAARRSTSTTSGSPTAAADRCCAASTCTCPPARRSRWSARPARARPRSPSCCAGSPTRPSGADPRRRRRPARPSTRRRAAPAIRMVPQDGFLFDTTVGENVRVGRPDATDDEVRAAFAALGLGGWLDDLPGGLDAPVGERGTQPVRRRAPARRPRPRPARRPGPADPRRGDVVGRPRDRAGAHRGARPPVRRAAPW